MFRQTHKLSNRSVELLNNWKGDSVTQLSNPHPDLAVAYGAVAYGKARHGAQLKIGGGSARSFYLQLEEKNKPNIVKIGYKEISYVATKNLDSYVGRRIRVKTYIGRPINGMLKAVHQDIIVLNTTFKSGSAEISLPIKKILSVEVIN